MFESLISCTSRQVISNPSAWSRTVASDSSASLRETQREEVGAPREDLVSVALLMINSLNYSSYN